MFSKNYDTGRFFGMGITKMKKPYYDKEEHLQEMIKVATNRYGPNEVKYLCYKCYYEIDEDCYCYKPTPIDLDTGEEVYYPIDYSV